MTGSPFASACPKCGRRAPIVIFGLDSRCAACGQARFLLAAPSVSFAGQPSRVGGLAASWAGLSVLVLGLSLSAGFWLLLQSWFPTRAFGWAVALPMGTSSLFFGLLLLFGGYRLRKRGAVRRAEVQLEAVRSLVEHRRGPISAHEVAGALQLPEVEVDALLTRLARQKATAVTIDVNAEGHVIYDFEGEDRRWRVLEQEAEAEAPAGPASERLRR